MASNKPVIHARDHLPGGADPLPGLEDLIAATAALVHAEGRYQITGDGNIDVTTGSGSFIDWAFIAGDPLLDLTNTDAPTPVVSGWYTVDATFSTQDGSDFTDGASFRAQLQFHGARLKFAWQQQTVDGPDIGRGSQGLVSLSGHLRAGIDTIDLFLANNDTVTHTLGFDTIEVSMVYATTP